MSSTMQDHMDFLLKAMSHEGILPYRLREIRNAFCSGWIAGENGAPRSETETFWFRAAYDHAKKHKEQAALEAEWQDTLNRQAKRILELESSLAAVTAERDRLREAAEQAIYYFDADDLGEFGIYIIAALKRAVGE